MEVLIHDAIPLTVVLIEVGGVPEVLVELAIGETGQLRVEVRREVECDEEDAQEGEHHWLVPMCEHFLCLHTLEEHVDKREAHGLLHFIDQAL